MNLHLTGHQLPITPAIREYVELKLQRLTHHFDNVIDVNVIMSVEKLKQKIEATVHLRGRVRGGQERGCGHERERVEVRAK